MRTTGRRGSAAAMTALLMLGGWSGAWGQATSVFEVDRP